MCAILIRAHLITLERRLMCTEGLKAVSYNSNIVIVYIKFYNADLY